ncbi:MAG TPA: hypothetical protein VK629_18180, partial [Steroidobacteraceae bacterium]|nr:hypothetical protein [Steroidobacteraceae bacterium]
PKELAVKASYEFGLVNVDQFNRSSGRACNLLDGNVRSLSLEAAEVCLSRYRSYIEAHDAQLQNADRFSIELAYVEVDDYAFISPQEGVTVSRPGVHRLDAALGYGRTLRVLSADYDSRLDVVAKYEDYSDDPSRRDRFIATATLTTQLSGVSIPVVLVYANHDVYLPEVDKSLTAHIGLQYRFGTKSE